MSRQARDILANVTFVYNFPILSAQGKSHFLCRRKSRSAKTIYKRRRKGLPAVSVLRGFEHWFLFSAGTRAPWKAHEFPAHAGAGEAGNNTKMGRIQSFRPPKTTGFAPPTERPWVHGHAPMNDPQPDLETLPGHCAPHHRHPLVRPRLLRPQPPPSSSTTMKPRVRCAIYTRKSSDEGLDQSFNSLDAQREAAKPL